MPLPLLAVEFDLDLVRPTNVRRVKLWTNFTLINVSRVLNVSDSSKQGIVEWKGR